MPPDADPLISVSAAARAIGVDKSTLAKQVRQGAVRSHEGKVRLSEVLADRAANIDLGRSKRRDGTIDEPERGVAAAVAQPRPDPEDEQEEGRPVLVDGFAMPYADARALKETYLAHLKRLEFETKRAELAPVAAMAAFVEREYATVRERLLAIPGKLSSELDADQIERLTAELYEALEELHAEGAAAEALGTARGEAEDDEDGA